MLFYPEALVLQMKRTKDSLLDVRWTIRERVHPELPEIIQEFAPLERWRSLTLCINPLLAYNIYIRPIGEIVPSIPDMFGTFENLEEMTLLGATEYSKCFIDMVEKSALKLRRLEIERSQEMLVRKHLPETCGRVAEIVLRKHANQWRE